MSCKSAASGARLPASGRRRLSTNAVIASPAGSRLSTPSRSAQRSTGPDAGRRPPAEEVPALRTLYMYISGGCNLKCRHCWITPDHDPAASRSTYLDPALARKAVEGALPLGLASVKLTGGEPMLHPAFRAIVEMLVENNLDILMETNGTLLDPGSARFLRGTNRFSAISVSLDGAGPATHDGLRGIAGSFDCAVGGIRVLVAEGFRPQMICTLHEGNVHEVFDVIRLADDLGCGSVKFNHVQTVGRGGGMPGRLPLRRLLELYRETRAFPQSGTGRDFRVVFDVPPAFKPVGELLKSGAGSCGIIGILGILSGGEMAMCGIGTAEPALVYGHLTRDGVQEVWTGAPGLLELRATIPGLINGVCASCIHRDACMGDCAASNYHRTGRLDSPYWFCEEAMAEGLFPMTRILPIIGS